MRTANPFNKFFTADLVVDDAEPGNALWGYHIANNLSRITSVEGTAVFPAYGDPLQGAITGALRFVDVPTGHLAFASAPAIQFTVKNSIIISNATTFTTSYPTGWVLENDLVPLDDHFYALGPPFDIRFYSGQILDLKLGENDSEVLNCMYLTQFYGVGPDRNQSRYTFQILARNRYDTPAGDGLTGENVRVVTSAQYTILSSRTEYDTINPPYVEGYLDQDKLRIRWLNQSEGTVYYKIFGA